MRQAYTGIPTEYAGVRFRSRLEAKWAAFFDLCEWTWEYEPFDLNGWIPDFRLGQAERPLLVEVKPISGLDSPLAAEALQKIKATDDGTAELCGGYEYLLLGDGPIENSLAIHEDYGSAIGWGSDSFLGEWTELYCHRISMRWQDYCHGTDPDPIYEPLGLISTVGSYRDRITGTYGGDHHLVYDGRVPQLVNAFWRRACNETQWKKPA